MHLPEALPASVGSLPTAQVCRVMPRAALIAWSVRIRSIRSSIDGCLSISPFMFRAHFLYISTKLTIHFSVKPAILILAVLSLKASRSSCRYFGSVLLPHKRSTQHHMARASAPPGAVHRLSWLFSDERVGPPSVVCLTGIRQSTVTAAEITFLQGFSCPGFEVGERIELAGIGFIFFDKPDLIPPN